MAIYEKYFESHQPFFGRRFTDLPSPGSILIVIKVGLFISSKTIYVHYTDALDVVYA